MNGDEKIHFDRATRLFVWDGPFEDRHIPEQAGFVFDQSSRKWTTKSPFRAFMLTPGLSELSFIKTRITASRSRFSAISVPTPGGRTLADFQKAGVAFCRSCLVGYNADEMGTGKTVQAIAQANLLGHKKNLVICPAHLRVNWEREIASWYIYNPSNWKIVSYERAADNASRLKQEGPFDFLVLDEVHYLKEQTSNRAKKILGTKYVEPLTRYAKQILLLSGTPLPNRTVECWTLLRALNPFAISDCLPFKAFAQRFAYLVSDEDGNLTVRGSRNEDELLVRLRGTFMIRRTKAEVLSQLPPKQYRMVVLEPDSETSIILEKEKPFSAAEIVKHGVPEGSPLADIRREMGLAKLPAAIRYVAQVLDEGERKLAVFAYHRDVVLGLYDALKDYGAVVVLGGLTDKKRQAAVDEFQQGSARVFIGNITAAGTGLTLTAASRLIRVEASWVPGENAQVEDRVARMGQDADRILVEDVVVRGSLDAMILGSAARKENATRKALDGGQN